MTSHSRRIRLPREPEAGLGTYRFVCPACLNPVEKRADRKVVDLLRSVGVQLSDDGQGELLTERPAIAGITLPGMPSGSPGMTGAKTQTFVIYAVTKDAKPPTVYATV